MVVWRKLTLSRSWWVSLGTYLLCVLWRWLYVFKWHRAEQYIYSDMDGYYKEAMKYLFPVTQRQDIRDTLYPPGGGMFFSFLLGLHPARFDAVAWGQWLISSLIPVFSALIAWELFRSARTVMIALVIASLYYPFIHYAGFFASENVFTFLVLAGFYLTLLAERPRKAPAAAALGFGSGLVFAAAASVKSMALYYCAGLWGFVCVVRLLGKKKLPLVALGTAVLGALLLVAPLSVRCTRLSEGKFCLIANDTSRNVLIGHSGETGSIVWIDSQRHLTYWFGNPTASQRGFKTQIRLPFGAYENAKTLAVAKEWISQHPLEALVLSFKHLYFLLGPAEMWPYPLLSQRKYMRTSIWLFYPFVLFPALILAWQRRREVLKLTPEGAAVLKAWLPVLILMAAVFVSASEPRYRVPVDGLLMVLAARFWDQLMTQISTKGWRPLFKGWRPTFSRSRGR